MRVTSASDMLADLAAQESAAALGRRLWRYIVLSCSASTRSGTSRTPTATPTCGSRSPPDATTCTSPIVISTNKAFSEWSEVFPHAACTVTLVDRLVHRSEIFEIEGDSYRLKEAKERAAQRSTSRKGKKSAA